MPKTLLLCCIYFVSVAFFKGVYINSGSWKPNIVPVRVISALLQMIHLVRINPMDGTENATLEAGVVFVLDVDAGFLQ